MAHRPVDPKDPDPQSVSGMSRRLLSRRNLWICVGLSVVAFLVWEGRGFRRSTGADAAALWSYAFIPPLVVLALIWERNLRPIPLMLATIEVTAWKFLVTYGVAQTVWVIWPPTTPPELRAARAVASVDRPADLPPSIIDPKSTGSIEGRVTTDGGVPLAGAVVYVDQGLERLVFAPPAEPLTILEGHGSLKSTSDVAQWGQEVEARSVDGQLHTLIASASEGDAFNIPLQSSGAWSHARFGGVTGVATLRCAVHAQRGETARLVITSNPFFTKTDAQGTFRLLGVPSLRVRITALGEESASASAETTVEAGLAKTVALSL